MNIWALALGLVCERFLTRMLHLRELRWFDPYFDWALAWIGRMRGAGAVLGTAVLCAVLVIPVVAVVIVFGDRLHHVPYVLFAAFVLIFSLGPRDLGRELDEYLSAIEADDAEGISRRAKELMESDAGSGADHQSSVEEAIFVQANNRLFGVIFWFLVAGPAGAWFFRVIDLMRRRARFESERLRAETGEPAAFLEPVRTLHGLLAWIPARLLALGYALAGRFEEAIRNWRGFEPAERGRFYEFNDRLLASVGRGAVALPEATTAERPEWHAARSAMRLVRRTLFVWITAIALMTLFSKGF